MNFSNKKSINLTILFSITVVIIFFLSFGKTLIYTLTNKDNPENAPDMTQLKQ